MNPRNFVWCLWLLGATAILSEATLAQTKVDGDHAPANPEGHSDPTAPLAGHSFHGEVFNEGPRQAAYPMAGTGLINFPVSTDNDTAQQFFNQGVGQLHGFWYFEAERSFRQAAALDNRCAMFFWGMAMANLKNPERAQKFIGQARERLDSATDREKKWIEAVGKFCTTKDAEDKEIPLEKRAQQYTRDLEEIVFMQPDDIEAKSFLVGHLWENQRKELATVSHVAVDALLQQIFDVAPMHPAHHYRIHVWDQRDAKQALKSAALCGPSAPGIAHMWHMPGHIYSGLNRYEDAVWQMEASARVDHAHMMRDRVLPDQIHNYAHNNEWLTRNLLKLGRVRDALALAENMLELPRHPKYNHSGSGSGNYGRQRTVQALTDYRMWDVLLSRASEIIEEAGEDKSKLRNNLRKLGITAAFAKQSERMNESLAKLEEALAKTRCEKDSKIAAAESAVKTQESNEQKVETESPPVAESSVGEVAKPAESTTAPAEAVAKSEPPKVDVSELDKEIEALEKALAAIRAADAAANERWQQALELASAADGIDALWKAEWQAAAGQAKPAWESVSNEVGNRPNDVVPLAVKVFVGHRILSQSAIPNNTENEVVVSEKPSDPPSSEKADELVITREMVQADFDRLRTVASQADLDTPLIARLRPIAETFGYPEDWRLPVVANEDIGERPDLDSLGPLHWVPSPAPSISVVDSQGNSSMELNSGGRAKIVLFYLGFGCLHCMEQLQKFSPQVEHFSENQIDVLAISCESAEQLQQGLANYSETLSIPLYSDIQLQSFKAFRCFDDFENQPLHGTFLIAPDGRVLWQDIGHQPFMDVDFLKTESKRLLEVWLN